MYTIKYIRKAIVRRIRGLLELLAKRKIKKNVRLWTEIDSYIKKSTSTRCSYSDYLELYLYIKKNKPVEVLECSTGVSTIVMAYAMMENEKESGIVGRITSMEESPKYYDIACQLLPPYLEKYIEIIRSQKVDAYYYFFRGVKYENIPEREYSFVFIDGPTTRSISDNQKTFDFDFIEVVSRSVKPIDAIIDFRLSTCYVLRKVFGKEKFKFDKYRSLGFLYSCSKNDLKVTNEIVGSYHDLI